MEPLPIPRLLWGGGFTPWLTRQGKVEADTHGEKDAPLLEQHLYGRLALLDSLRMATRVRLSIIPSVEEALWDLGLFTFVASQLFSVGGRNSPGVAELLRLIKRLNKLHTKVKGMI